MFYKISYSLSQDLDNPFTCKYIQIMKKLHCHCLMIYQHQRYKHHLETEISLIYYMRKDKMSNGTIPSFNKRFFQTSFFVFELLKNLRQSKCEICKNV